jgi:hypothetical protein
MLTSTLFLSILVCGFLLFVVTKLAFDTTYTKRVSEISKLPHPRRRKTSIRGTTSVTGEAQTEPTCYSVVLNSSCFISSDLLRYWDDEVNCEFYSPLRIKAGLSNPKISERKYLIMQPDLGGQIFLLSFHHQV